MNLFQKTIGRLFLGSKTMDIAALIDAAEKQGWISNSYGSRVRDGYKRNTTAYAGIRKVATNCAGVPWLLFREIPGEEDDEAIYTHDALTLMKRPSEKISQVRFLEELVTYLLTSGHSYSRKITVESLIDRPAAEAIVNLQPDKVRKAENGNGWYYANDPQMIPSEEILHLNLLDPLSEDGGLSPLEVSAIQIDQGNSARLWNKNLLKQGGRPSGMVKSKTSMQPEEKEKILNSFMSRVAGAANAGLPIIATGEIEWSPTGISPAEMEWMQGMIHADRGVAISIGVPPQLLGDKETTYANYAEARKALYQETILPLLVWIMGEFSQFLLVASGSPDLYFAPDIDAVDALHEARKDEWERVRAADWLTVNEKRSATRYGALDGEGGSLIITAAGVVIREDGSVLLPSTLIPMETIDAALDEPPPANPPIPPPGKNPPPNPPAPPTTPPADQPEDKPPEKGAKFFSLITEDQKKAHWTGVESLRKAYVMVARVRAARIFGSERKRVVNAAKSAGTLKGIPAAVSDPIKGSTSAWEDFYKKTYSQTGAIFARRVHDAILKSEGGALEEKATAIADKWLAHIAEVIEDESADKVVGIGQTTKDRIKAVVQQTIDAGLGIVDAANAIDDLYLDEIIPNRSEVIARTEVVGASNKASNFAAEDTGLDLNKEWIRTYDDRIRDSHMAVTEKAIPMDKPFKVGGSLMMYPGDSSLGADAADVINCRCTIGYAVK